MTTVAVDLVTVLQEAGWFLVRSEASRRAGAWKARTRVLTRRLMEGGTEGLTDDGAGRESGALGEMRDELRNRVVKGGDALVLPALPVQVRSEGDLSRIGDLRS